MVAATSSSHGTRRMNVDCGVLSRTRAPAVPPMRPATIMGTRRRRFLRTSSRYAATDVTCPGQSATVLVALACTGRIPVPSSAGKDRKEPPPATAFSTPARKAAITSQIQCQSREAEASKRDIDLMVKAGSELAGLAESAGLAGPTVKLPEARVLH